jgi:hypothetical protein
MPIQIVPQVEQHTWFVKRWSMLVLHMVIA